MPQQKVAYFAQQKIVAVEHEAVGSPAVKDEWSQPALWLLTSSFDGPSWLRHVQEYSFAEKDIPTIKSATVKLPDLRALHSRTLAARPILLDPEPLLKLNSDALNSHVHTPPPRGMVPYEIEDTPIPVPLFSLHWPTVTPKLPRERQKSAATWPGKLAVRCGAGHFPIAYNVKLIDYIEEDALVEVAISESPASAQAGDVTLHLLARGHWNIRISHIDGLWLSASGVVDILLRGNECKKCPEGDLLACRNEFTVERVPVTFDNEKINAIAWK